MSGRWLVTGVPTTLTDGGSLRAHHIFRDVARRTDAAVVSRGGGRALTSALLRHPSRLGSNLAAAQLLRTRAWPVVRRLVRPAVLDLFDHPVLQMDALGMPMAPDERRHAERVVASMVGSFERVVVVTDSAGELFGVPAHRRVVIPNGTDTSTIRPLPLPEEPVIAMVSGATPGRGIESLIAAVKLLRGSVPEARLELALAIGGPAHASRAYLESIRLQASALDWLNVRTASYGSLSAFLGEARVLVVPHPASAYMDIAAPVKLFDSMAAGRPLVVTPRTETARFVRECGSGVVAASDGAEDIAAALAGVLADDRRAGDMASAARQCAETRFDWGVLSRRLAEEVLGPES